MLRALFAMLLLVLPAAAQPAIQAHPTLWHVRHKGDPGEAWLLGSVHVLPPNVQWRTPQIRRALAKADVFVFEVPEDAATVARLQGLIQSQGYLPPGESLRAQLHPAVLPDYDAAVAAAGVPATAIDRDRPWLAGIQLMFAQIGKLHYDAGNGVDAILMADAMQGHKALRYFETIEQQFALLAPGDATLELQEFESGLKDLRDVEGGIQPMIDAWGAGDQTKLDALINGDLDDYPQARKLLLDDRNARWVPQIEAMLKEKHAFFITVGAGHLTGAKGVPALLRQAGYTVEGP